jgi:hypothetical protein
MHILALCGLSAVVKRVNLPETGFLPLLTGVEDPYGDTAFEGRKSFGEALPLHPESGFILFQVTVYGCGGLSF